MTKEENEDAERLKEMGEEQEARCRQIDNNMEKVLDFGNLKAKVNAPISTAIGGGG